MAACQPRGNAPVDRRRLHCPSCRQSWFPSVYLAEIPHRCAVCGGPLEMQVADPGEAEMPALWEMRLSTKERMLLRREGELRPAEDLPLEALELLLDGVYRFFGGNEIGTLGGRATWAELVLGRALEGFAGPLGSRHKPQPPVEGSDAILALGERVLASIDASATGREAALTIAGLSGDELRSGLLAAAQRRAEGTRSPGGVGEWISSLRGFVSRRRPEDLL